MVVCVSVTCPDPPAVCFEDDSRLMTVTEAERKACVNVTRSIGDPDEFEYQVVASRRTDRASGTVRLAISAHA